MKVIKSIILPINRKESTKNIEITHKYILNNEKIEEINKKTADTISRASLVSLYNSILNTPAINVKTKVTKDIIIQIKRKFIKASKRFPLIIELITYIKESVIIANCNINPIPNDKYEIPAYLYGPN